MEYDKIVEITQKFLNVFLYLYFRKCGRKENPKVGKKSLELQFGRYKLEYLQYLCDKNVILIVL